MKRFLPLLALHAFGLFAANAPAHEVRPAYLEIRENTQNQFTILWKQPVMGDRAIRLIPHLSNGWLESSPADEQLSASFLVRRWQVRSAIADPLNGRSLQVEGLDRTITDALVSVRLADGRSLETILTPECTSAELAFQRTGGLAVPAYFRLGVGHILTGADHLMFVFGLLLLVGIRWRLVSAITAFTVAHSISLAASTVGLVHVPSTVIEALVALSIVFVASEVMNQRCGRGGGLTVRYPWLIAFTFGLLHGFAFAGALAEVGLPQDAIPQSLLLFNLGVEAGQLLFIGAAIVLIAALRQFASRGPSTWTLVALRIPPYVIGCFAAFWFLERTAAAFA